MRDTWWAHNTDKILLLVLLILGGKLLVHELHHHDDPDAVKWTETEMSTVLGAEILILTGRVNRADGQTTNGMPPTAQPGATPPTVTPPLTLTAERSIFEAKK